VMPLPFYLSHNKRCYHHQPYYSICSLNHLHLSFVWLQVFTVLWPIWFLFSFPSITNCLYYFQFMSFENNILFLFNS
jgi:hypothetical protein